MRRRRSLKSVKKVVKKPTTLAGIMKIALLIHKDGLVWVFHSKEIPDGLDWVDYDADENKIYFVNKRGVPLDLGLKMKASQKEHLMNCEFLMTAHVEANDVKNMTLAPFIVRTLEVDNETDEKTKKN